MSGSSDTEQEAVPNQKLLELADRIDHEQLWRRSALEHIMWSQDQRDRYHAGVALRRYADLLSQDCWRLFPPKGGLTIRAGTFERLVELAWKTQTNESTLPTRVGLYAWENEGHAALVLVHKRPTAHQPGYQLHASVVESTKLYDGCEVSDWGRGGRWTLLRDLEPSDPSLDSKDTHEPRNA